LKLFLPNKAFGWQHTEFNLSRHEAPSPFRDALGLTVSGMRHGDEECAFVGFVNPRPEWWAWGGLCSYPAT